MYGIPFTIRIIMIDLFAMRQNIIMNGGIDVDGCHIYVLLHMHE
jgi:hypothetical protein